MEPDTSITNRIEREGEGPRVGAVLAARLVEAGKSPMVALDWPGAPLASLTGLAPATSIGAALTVEITRSVLRERGRNKPARAPVAAAGALLGDGADPLSFTPLTPPHRDLVEISVGAGLFKKKTYKNSVTI